MAEFLLDQPINNAAVLASAPASATPSLAAPPGRIRIAQARSATWTDGASGVASRFLWIGAPRARPPAATETVWRGELALITAAVAPIGAVGSVACFQGSRRAGFRGEDSFFLCFLPVLGVGTTGMPPVAHFFRGSVWRGVASASLLASMSLGTAALFAIKPVTSKHDSDGRWFSASIGFGIGAFTASMIDAFALSWYPVPAKQTSQRGVIPWLDVRSGSISGGLGGSF